MHLVSVEVDMVPVEDLGHDAPLRGHPPAASAQPFQQVTHKDQPNSRGLWAPIGCGFGAFLDLDIVHCRIRLGYSQATGRLGKGTQCPRITKNLSRTPTRRRAVVRSRTAEPRTRRRVAATASGGL